LETTLNVAVLVFTVSDVFAMFILSMNFLPQRRRGRRGKIFLFKKNILLSPRL